MSMLRLIASREITEYFRDGRLVWAGALVSVLLFTALAVGWHYQRAIDAERTVAQVLDYDDWIKQAERHPHDAAHQGMHVFKPEPPLSIVDPGIGPFVGSTIWLQAHRQSETKFRPAQDATGLQRFGTLSAAWVLQILGPLLVIVLGFNAFAGEREQGTLRQALSLGVSARSLLYGKALALATILCMLFLPAAVLVAVAVAWSSSAGAAADALLRLSLLFFVYAVYLGITIFLVLAISALVRSSRVSLIMLLGLWIGGATLAPRAASDLSRLAHPSPSRIEFSARMDKELGEERSRAWQDAFGVGTPWSSELSLDKWGLALQVDDKAGYGVMDRNFDSLWQSFDRQQRAQEWPGLLIPLLALRGLSMSLAGTDFPHHREFAVAAERQRRIMQDIISADLIDHADSRGNQHFTYKAGEKLWQSVPRFDYVAPGAGFALAQSQRSLGVLLGALALVWALAHWAAGRRFL